MYRHLVMNLQIKKKKKKKSVFSGCSSLVKVSIPFSVTSFNTNYYILKSLFFFKILNNLCEFVFSLELFEKRIHFSL